MLKNLLESDYSLLESDYSMTTRHIVAFLRTGPTLGNKWSGMLTVGRSTASLAEPINSQGRRSEKLDRWERPVLGVLYRSRNISSFQPALVVF